MQMVSAAKMRKAQTAVLASRTYSSLAWELILSLASKIHSSEPLMLTYPHAKKVGIVLLGSNRGLVGSLNSNLASKIAEIGGQGEVISEAVVFGRQAKRIAQRTGEPILADFEKVEKTITSEDIYPLAKYITDAYVSGEYKSIVIIYNHFVSTLIQRPTIKQLLPFIPTAPSSVSDVTSNDERPDDEMEEIDLDYIFEPTPKDVLEHLVPRIVESQLYQTILESDASEHSARMVMMKNATEAAGDLIANLTLTYNQLRQNKITTELAEITAGRIALE